MAQMYHEDGREVTANPEQFTILGKHGWLRKKPEGWDEAAAELKQSKADALVEKTEKDAEVDDDNPNADVNKEDIDTGDGGGQ